MKMFDVGKTRMIGLLYGEKNYDDMLSRFHMVPERIGRADGRTHRHTDRFAISISRVSMLTHDKNCVCRRTSGPSQLEVTSRQHSDGMRPIVPTNDA